MRTWNAGGCCGYARDKDIDDVDFISTVLDYLMENYAVDTTRVYATGMSNGGFMAYRLACELSDRIAAIAPVASTMSMPKCEASRPVPVIHFHSTLDSNVPYQGGEGDGLSDHYNPPLDSVMQVWKHHSNCSDSEFVSFTHDMVRYAWRRCDCQVEIEYYLTSDGGHSWPGGTKPFGTRDDPSKAVSASETMWSFFQKHTLDCKPSEIEEPREKWTVYPNPVRDVLVLSGLEGVAQITVFSAAGEEKVFITTSGSTLLDVSSLPKGIYLVNVKSHQFNATSRFVKQ